MAVSARADSAQAAVNENQIIIAASVVDGHDSEVFGDMVELIKHKLDVVAARCPIEALVADAGYNSRANATVEVGVPLIAARAGHRQSRDHVAADDNDTDHADDDANDAVDDADADDAVDVVDPIEAIQAEAELTQGRARVLPRVFDGELSINAVARELALCWKTTRDLFERFKAGGAAGIVRKHRRNGEGPNPKTKAAVVGRTKAWMNAPVTHPAGRVHSQTVEPVFGQIKDPRGIRRFQRRGHAACNSEGQLIAATHNVLKLWRATTSA